MAALAQRLAAETVVDLTEVMAYAACHFIPLDKQHHVQPIGIGDVPRMILYKALFYILCNDISGVLQICAGREAVSKAAAHEMNTTF